jgi:hypothetical protein
MAKSSCAEEARVSALPESTFPNWVPLAVIDIAKRLCAELAAEQEPAKAERVLSQLTSDPRMKRVWYELYKKKRLNHRPTDEFWHPVRVTQASQAAASRKRAIELRKSGGVHNNREADHLEAEATALEGEPGPAFDQRYTEQDRGAQLFFYHAYRAALDLKPVLFSDLKANANTLKALADRLRKEAEILRSFEMEREVRKLNEVASDCDDRVWNIDPDNLEPGDDLWIVRRQKGDVQLRTFVASLSIPTVSLFDDYLYGTIAIVANVALGRDDVRPSKVREILRVHPGD